MSIEARWADLTPGTVIARDQHRAVVATRQDVTDLVAQLSSLHTSEAYLVHQGRPRKVSKATGRSKPDHGLVLAVREGYGYAEYTDPTHYCQTIGDPNSPEWHTSHQGHFLPGSGIPITDLIELVTEFLTTAETPTCLRWHDLMTLPRTGRTHRTAS